MISASWGCCWNFRFEPNDVTSRLQNLGVIHARSGENSEYQSHRGVNSPSKAREKFRILMPGERTMKDQS
jgi:hypothetical protein